MSNFDKLVSIIEKAESTNTKKEKPVTPSKPKSRSLLKEGTQLTEGRHDDLIKQSFDAMKTKLNSLEDVPDSMTDIVKKYENHWNTIRRSVPFKENMPNKWKYFIADIHRQSLMKAILNSGIDDPKLQRKIKFQFITGKVNEAYDVMLSLIHFSGIDYPPITEFDPNKSPNTAIADLRQLEKEWESFNDEWIPSNGSEELIIDLGKFKWFDLGVGACNDEGSAMGHCGNAPSERSGDTIYSLRQVKNMGGQEYHRPSLTFIANHGVLGEMKGRANNKPNEKYHPYIMELLKSKYITGIKGGGYMPESNFHPDDLTEEQRQELIELKGEEFLEVGGLKQIEKLQRAFNDGEDVGERLAEEANTYHMEQVNGGHEGGFYFYLPIEWNTIAKQFFATDLYPVLLGEMGEYEGYIDGSEVIEDVEDYVEEVPEIRDIYDALEDDTKDGLIDYYEEYCQDEISTAFGIDTDAVTREFVSSNLFSIIKNPDISDMITVSFHDTATDLARSVIMEEVFDNAIGLVEEVAEALGLSGSEIPENHEKFVIFLKSYPTLSIKNDDVVNFLENCSTFQPVEMPVISIESVDLDGANDAFIEALSANGLAL